jgi:hypothetical protein
MNHPVAAVIRLEMRCGGGRSQGVQRNNKNIHTSPALQIRAALSLAIAGALEGELQPMLLVFALDYSIKLLTLENGTMATSSSTQLLLYPFLYSGTVQYPSSSTPIQPTHTLTRGLSHLQPRERGLLVAKALAFNASPCAWRIRKNGFATRFLIIRFWAVP